MTDRQATLFEELEELREQVHRMVRMAPLEDQVPAFIAVGQGIDALLARHRESERWHYPADGDVPQANCDVLAFAEPDIWAVVTYDHESCLWETADGYWLDDPGLDDCGYVTPTRWRYLSPADVPEREP